MRYLLTLLLATSIARPIQIVFVEPQGETFTNEEKAEATRAVADAALFWQPYADLQIESAQTITTTADPYSDLTWSNQYLTLNNSGLTVFVIDNSNSRLYMDGAVGFSQDYYGAVYAVLDSAPGALPAIIAHEFGHAVWQLPDLPRGRNDIMSMPPTYAYHNGFIGCQSLNQVGGGCAKVWLPRT
jgi:hypothetical protein